MVCIVLGLGRGREEFWFGCGVFGCEFFFYVFEYLILEYMFVVSVSLMGFFIYGFRVRVGFWVFLINFFSGIACRLERFLGRVFEFFVFFVR